VSSAGASGSIWSRSGRSLYYKTVGTPSELWEATLDLAAGRTVSRTRLFVLGRDTTYTFTQVLPRDTGFLAHVQPSPLAAETPIRWVMLENAPEAIRRLLGREP